jgi:hypothetical protein
MTRDPLKSLRAKKTRPVGLWATALTLWLAAGSGQSVFSATPETTNSPAPVSLDYSSFRIIAEKNIFNSRRYGRSTSSRRESRPASRVESFALLGTMSYEKGPFAFFESSRSDYQKVLKPTDTIAGYTITEIQPSYVRLNSGSNELQLRVGMQLRREDDGPWHASDRPEPVESSADRPVVSSAPATNALPPRVDLPPGTEAPPPPINIVDGEPIPLGDEPPPVAVDPAATPTQAAPAAPGSPEEVLRRLMERRRQEENP